MIGEEMFGPDDFDMMMVGYVEDGVVFFIGEDGIAAPAEELSVDGNGNIVFEVDGEMMIDETLELREDGTIWFNPASLLLGANFDPSMFE